MVEERGGGLRREKEKLADHNQGQASKLGRQVEEKQSVAFDQRGANKLVGYCTCMSGQVGQGTKVLEHVIIQWYRLDWV